MQFEEAPGSIWLGAQEYVVKRAFANVPAATTDHSLVTAVAGKKIHVLSVTMLCGSTETAVTFNTKPAGAGSAISMQFQLGANGGAVLPHNIHSHFNTLTAEGLTVTTGAGSTVGVMINYIERAR